MTGWKKLLTSRKELFTLLKVLKIENSFLRKTIERV